MEKWVIIVFVYARCYTVKAAGDKSTKLFSVHLKTLSQLYRLLSFECVGDFE
jgi:hypothetical protein